MTENILPQTPAPPRKMSKKAKASWVAVLLVIILTMVLVGLGERLMFDLNRWFNPAYSQYGGRAYTTSSIYDATEGRVYDQEAYELYRLGIHTAFAIPVLLATFLVYYIVNYKKPWSPKRLVVWPYFIFAIWMMIHLVFETFYFLIRQYQTLGIYVVLILLVVLFTWLALFIQKKHHEKRQQQNSQIE